VGASELVRQDPKSLRWQIWEFRRYSEKKGLWVREAPECAWVARHWWSAASGFHLSNSCCNNDPADNYSLLKLIGRIKPAGLHETKKKTCNQTVAPASKSLRPGTAESKGRRFTFNPDRQRFRNAQFRLLRGCEARHVHVYNFPWSSTPHMPIMEEWRQRGRKKYRKTGTLLFLHARQSSKIQSTDRNGAHWLKDCELVVLSIAKHSALGAMMSVSGGLEHASPPEVLMREIHL